MQTVTLQVADEVYAVGQAVAAVKAAIAAKQGVIADITAGVMPLVSAVSALPQIGVDIKKADNQAYLAYAFLKAFEG